MNSTRTLEEIKEAHPLLFAGPEPDTGEMQKEFQRSGTADGAWLQRERNDRIRFNRWPGRTSDYRKHKAALKKEPVPWEDASDARVYLADGVIEDLTDVLASAVDRAQLKVKPTEAADIPRAGATQLVLEKARERMGPVLKDETEYLAQFGLNDGKAVLQVGWQRVVALKDQAVTLDDVLAAGQQAAEVLGAMPASEMGTDLVDKLDRMQRLPGLVMDPLAEGAAAELIQAFARDIAAQLFHGERGRYGDGFLAGYALDARKARAVVRGLRNEGRASFPGPYLSRNEACVVARRVGEDYFCPPEMTDVQTSAWHVVREFLTPEEVMRRQVAEDWDYDWCLKAIGTAGQVSAWGLPNHVSTQGALDEDTDAGEYAVATTENGLVEVLHFYKRYLTDEGVPRIYCTVFSPHCPHDPLDPERAIYAKHYPYTDLPDQYPFCAWRWQKKSRCFVQGMGVPQLLGSDQDAIKTSVDLLRDRQSIEVNPERIVNSRLGMKYKAGPGSQTSSAQYYGTRPLIEYASAPTGNPALAFNLIEETHKRVDNYFGLMTERVLPAKWQSKLQRLVERYLAVHAEMWSMVLKLIQNPDVGADLGRISELASDLAGPPEEISGSFDVSLYFDVKDLDMEFVFKKIEAILKWAVPADRSGRIPMDTLVGLILNAIDPTYAQMLPRDTASASQKVFKETREQIDSMAAGNPPDLVENDPTAAMKLQFAQQIIFGDNMGNRGNPKHQQALQTDQVFREAIEKWTANLQQSVTQEHNKQIGRLGVDPAA